MQIEKKKLQTIKIDDTHTFFYYCQKPDHVKLMLDANFI